MSFRECIYKSVKLYCVLVTLITAAIFVMGTALAPDARFGYESMISPLKYAALGVLPTFVMVSEKEFSMVEFIIRKVFQLAIIECEILFCLRELAAEGLLIFVAISVLVVFVLANAISAAGDWLMAKRLTRELGDFRKNAEISR